MTNGAADDILEKVDLPLPYLAYRELKLMAEDSFHIEFEIQAAPYL